MTDPMILIDVCGTSLADAVLLASPADEWFNEEGDIPPDARTLFFRLNGGKPQYFGMVPFPLRQAWRSRSAVYFTTESADHVYVLEGQDWTNPRRETVIAGETTEWRVWGLSGDGTAEDVVFVGGRDCVYVRRGQWERFAAPAGSGRVNRGHGIRPDEFYLGSDIGLLRWDGAALSLVETPEELGMDDVHVVSEKELLATTGTRLFRWHDDAEWTEIDTPFSTHGNFAELGRVVYLAGWEDGVFMIDGSTVKRSTELECWSLISLRDGMVAISSLEGQQHAFFDGSQWKELVVPGCQPGQLPT